MWIKTRDKLTAYNSDFIRSLEIIKHGEDVFDLYIKQDYGMGGGFSTCSSMKEATDTIDKIIGLIEKSKKKDV